MKNIISCWSLLELFFFMVLKLIYIIYFLFTGKYEPWKPLQQHAYFEPRTPAIPQEGINLVKKTYVPKLRGRRGTAIYSPWEKVLAEKRDLQLPLTHGSLYYTETSKEKGKQ